jgi:lantibiotic transport system permease protein
MVPADGFDERRPGMILTLCRVELLKIRRSLVLLMTLACPMAVVALVFAMNLRRSSPQTMGPDQWVMLWVSVSAMWSWFMLPLYIALSTSLINGNEHRNQTWRLMLSLPITPVELYTAKALIAIGLMLLAHLAVLTGTALAICGLGLFGYHLEGAFPTRLAPMLLAAPVAALPMLLLQHAISWRIRSIVPPLAVSVVATFAAMQVGSSEYWPWLPWTYPMVSSNASSEAVRSSALILAPSLAVVLFPLTAWWLGRREVV